MVKRTKTQAKELLRELYQQFGFIGIQLMLKNIQVEEARKPLEKTPQTKKKEPKKKKLFDTRFMLRSKPLGSA